MAPCPEDGGRGAAVDGKSSLRSHKRDCRGHVGVRGCPGGGAGHALALQSSSPVRRVRRSVTVRPPADASNSVAFELRNRLRHR